MSLWTTLLSLFESLLSPLFAWRHDRIEEPSVLTSKRRELIDTIPRGSHVLEIGAGTGGTLTSGAYEGSAGRFARLVLSEPDSSMRARLESKLQGRASGVSAGELKVIDAGLPSLPFVDGEFDVVVVFLVLSNVDGRRQGIAEIARVLKIGGKMLIMDHGVHNHHHGHTDPYDQDDGQDHDCTYRENAAVERRREPYFMEWLRNWRHRRDREDLDSDLLVDEIRAEQRLEEVFTRKAPVERYFFKEVVYGCFERKQEPDG